MAIYYLVLFLTACIWVLALRQHPNRAADAYRALPVLSLSPYLLHTWYSWNFISGFGPPAQPSNGIYPGLVAFAVFSISLMVGLGILAIRLARRFPLAVALTPMVLGIFYWQISLRLLYWQAPGFFLVDNVPLIWLFLLSVLSTVLMGLCAAIALKDKRPT